MIKQLTVLGHAETVTFPELGIFNVPARVDTGAKTSSLWASKLRMSKGVLKFVLFDKESKYYTGKNIETMNFESRFVASSNGLVEERYAVKLVLNLVGHKIRATFTLANRSSQAYPVLVGRNILRGKFLVDVTQADALAKDQHRPSRKHYLRGESL